MNNIINTISEGVEFCAEQGFDYELNLALCNRDNILEYKRDILDGNMVKIDIKLAKYSELEAEKEFLILFSELRHRYLNCYIKNITNDCTIFEWISLYNNKTGFLVRVKYY